MKTESLSSCMKRLEVVRLERDALRDRVTELEAAAKLALTEIDWMIENYAGRSMIRAAEALRKAGVK